MIESKAPLPLPLREKHLVLTLPVSVNEMYRQTAYKDKQGVWRIRRVATAQLRNYKQIVAGELMAQFVGEDRQVWRNAQELGYSSTFYTRTKLSDTSNRIKSWEDAIAGFLGIDDNMFIEIHCYRECDLRNPRQEVSLYLLA